MTPLSKELVTVLVRYYADNELRYVKPYATLELAKAEMAAWEAKGDSYIANRETIVQERNLRARRGKPLENDDANPVR